MCEWNKKRVLITGGTGLIGSHLTKELLSKGAVVVIMGRSEKKIKCIFKNEIDNNNFSYILKNISEEIPKNVGKIDYVFHAASPISGKEIKYYPLNTIMANLNGTINCLDYLRKQKHGRMVVFSSATVYGNQFAKEMSVREGDTYRADALHTGNIAYSESKRMIEVIASAYTKQYNVDTVIARMGYVYGYTEAVPDTAFYEFIKKALQGENIILNNSGMGRRDNIYVEDVVAGLLLVAQKGVTGEAYNLSSNGEAGNYKAIDEIAQMIANSVNHVNEDSNIQVILPACNGYRGAGLRLDNAKAHELGWDITVSLKDGIERTVEAFNDYYEAKDKVNQ